MPSDDDYRPGRGDRTAGSHGSPAPRGRPSRVTIWRRRITVLLALLVVLALIVWGVVAAWGALFGDDDAAAAGGSASGSASESASESSSESGSAAPVGGDPVDCTTDQLELAMDGAGQYAGAPVEFAVDLTNTGDRDCLVDAGPGALVVQVTSGNDVVWSSEHCAAEESRMLLLGPDSASEAVHTWPGTRSSEGCPEDAPTVGPGTYRAVLLVDGAEVADTATVFTLEEAPPEAPSDGENPSEGEGPSDAEAPSEG